MTLQLTGAANAMAEQRARYVNALAMDFIRRLRHVLANTGPDANRLCDLLTADIGDHVALELCEYLGLNTKPGPKSLHPWSRTGTVRRRPEGGV